MKLLSGDGCSEFQSDDCVVIRNIFGLELGKQNLLAYCVGNEDNLAWCSEFYDSAPSWNLSLNFTS